MVTFQDPGLRNMKIFSKNTSNVPRVTKYFRNHKNINYKNRSNFQDKEHLENTDFPGDHSPKEGYFTKSPR